MGSFNFNPEKATQEVSDLFLFSTKYGGLKVINQSNLKVINHFKDTDSTLYIWGKIGLYCIKNKHYISLRISQDWGRNCGCPTNLSIANVNSYHVDTKYANFQQKTTSGT